ncbi:MAG: hypothetical protein HY279_14360, partial [Nitrospinae bacterium]|nr:hypothetical protein [Nitrospinota bacterium]
LVGIFYNPPYPPFKPPPLSPPSEGGEKGEVKEGEKGGVEKEEKKKIPIAAITEPPPPAPVEGGKPEISGGPETVTGGGGVEGWSSLFSKRNTLISAIVISILTAIALISAYLIKKKRMGDRGKKESPLPSPEEKAVETESASPLEFSEGTKIESHEELTAGGALFGEGGMSGELKTGVGVSPAEIEVHPEPVEGLFTPASEMPVSTAGESPQPLDFPIDLKFEADDGGEKLLKEPLPEPVPAVSEVAQVFRPDTEQAPDRSIQGQALFEETPSETGGVELASTSLHPSGEVSQVFSPDTLSNVEIKEEVETLLPAEDVLSALDLPVEEPHPEPVEGLEIAEPSVRQAHDVEDVLEGIVIEDETEGVEEAAVSELQAAPFQSAGSEDGGLVRQAHDVDVEETLIDSTFKGFATEDDTSHVKEDAVDFSDFEKGDTFEDLAIPAEDVTTSPAGTKDLDMTVGSVITDLSIPSEDGTINIGGAKEQNLNEEIEYIKEGDIINGVELKEENFSPDIILEESKSEKGQKSPDDQIKEWEKLLLID